MDRGMKVVLVLLTIGVLFGQVMNCAAQDIGLAWVGKSGMANRVTTGFDEAIKQLAPNISIEYKKELASLDDLKAVVDEWQKSKKGMVIIRSNGAEWLGENPPQIPTFIGACNHPGLLGAVKNLDAPEGNITGVTYFLPFKTQFEIFKAILPELKSVLLIVDERHPGAPIDRDGTKKVCDELGISYQEKLISNKDEAIAAAKEASGKVSAIILGTQAIIIDNAADIVAAAGSTPTLAYTDKSVKAGALGGFAADDQKLGGMLAQSVTDVLVNGKSVKEVPIKMDPTPHFFINAKTAEKLGIEIPYNILETATVIE